MGTILVETPFLLHLAGTSAWQRFVVLGLGFGLMLASAILLILQRRHLSPTQGCIIALDTAYLANAALCLVVYSDATGTLWSHIGWVISIGLVWPMAIEVLWLFGRSFQTRNAAIDPRAT